ncbi:alanine racemase [Nocardia stercoris]|uniref:Alanine racemase n=1 Tax=Nocardia stercoris TaxID=2483361 RepID=A0A3M2L5K8_9NOCA|nr:alanine racemase [Nocardia stercoris]RMI31813.1 alanine racemase [Nocardia stercoris]
MAGSDAVSSAEPQVETVIDLDAVQHNVRVLADHAGAAAVMAVVKADAYNHGAVPVARAALAAGAAELGVTTIAEALELRRNGIDAPILTWLNTSDADYGSAIEAGIEIGVSSVAHVRAVEQAARRTGTTATVTLKVDTGLNRNGVSDAEFPQVLKLLSELVAEEVVRFRAVFTHLAHADQPRHPVIDRQRDRFLAAVAAATEHGLKPELVHMANSAATLTRPDLAFDMVRPGIAIYGLSPVEGDDYGLRPVMTFRARVALVKEVAAGEGVSYGHEWIAAQDTTVALIPAGYADGVPRGIGGRFAVRIGERDYPNIGRVCMDQLVVDLGANPAGVREGDTAVLFGGVPGGPHAQQWADALGSIHYEIVCAPRGRVVRRYTGSGR